MYTEMPSSGVKQDTPPPPYSEGAAPWEQKKPPTTPDPSAGNVRTVIVVENFQVKALVTRILFTHIPTGISRNTLWGTDPKKVWVGLDQSGTFKAVSILCHIRILHLYLSHFTLQI